MAALAGKPVRLRFVMRDTKLYSFQFLEQSADKGEKNPSDEK